MFFCSIYSFPSPLLLDSSDNNGIRAQIGRTVGPNEGPPHHRRRQSPPQEDRSRLQINIAPKKIGFNEEIFVVDLKKGEVTKGPYEGGKPDATFSFTDADFLKIATGKMNPQLAFMRGAMKVKGSLSAAQKFTPDIFPKPSKM